MDRSTNHCRVGFPIGTLRFLAPPAVITGIVLVLQHFQAMPVEQIKAAVLVATAIWYWARGAVPTHYTALLFFLFAMLFSVAPPEVVFSGFTSGAFWLVFGGLVLGVAVRNTGLAERVALGAARKIGGAYSLVVAGVVFTSASLGFLLPSSMARVVILIPIAVALADHFGFDLGSKGRTGIVLAATFGSHVPAFSILSANLPNMVLAGSAESIHGISFFYGRYLLLHFPVLGVLKAAAIAALILWLYPDRLETASKHCATEKEPFSRDERLLSSILLVALLLWMTDSLHQVSPAWVALGAALVVMAPGVALVSSRQFRQEMNYGPLFFVAGILGLGAVIAHSGLGRRLVAVLLELLPLEPGNAPLNYMSLTATSLLTGLVTTHPGVPAVLTPLAARVAHAAHLPVETVLMSQVLGFSTPIFPYESPPLVVGMQLSGERLRPALRLCLALTVVTVTVLLPIDYLWWRFLGIL